MQVAGRTSRDYTLRRPNLCEPIVGSHHCSGDHSVDNAAAYFNVHEATRGRLRELMTSIYHNLLLPLRLDLIGWDLQIWH